MRDNPVQFAVVREDPALEIEVLKSHSPQRILTIGSGGCTAFELQRAFPETDLTLVEPNPAQIELIQRKMKALHELAPGERHAAFNIASGPWTPEGFASPDERVGFSNSGNFESLFRGLRHFINDYILPHDTMRGLFEPDHGPSLADAQTLLFDHPYWPVGFQLFFSDPLLNTMFGPDATQHATPGSYPGYFQAIFERGLRAPLAVDNWFLHHVLLGYYLDRPGALPPFLAQPAPRYRFSFDPVLINDVKDLGSYDMVGLSNICDWMSSADVAALMETLAGSMKPGSLLIYRQLNNERDIEGLLGSSFEFDAAQNQRLFQQDRSLFYSSVHIGKKCD